MTKDETKKIIGIMMVTWPNYKPELTSDMVNIMHEMIGDLKFELCAAGLKAFAQQDKNGFAPSVGQLRAKVAELTSPEELGAGEAWAMVRRAAGRSTYFAKEEFAKLPIQVQRAVGSPETLRDWAMNEESEMSIAMNTFLKRFNVVQNRDREMLQLSDDLKNAYANRSKLKENAAKLYELIGGTT